MAISFPSTSLTAVGQNVGTDLRATPPQVQSQLAAAAPQPAQPSTASAQASAAAATPSSEEVKKAIDAINRRLDESSRNLQFSLDHDSGKMIVRVVDTATNEVIRQIPSEVALAISQSLEKLQGLLLKQRA